MHLYRYRYRYSYIPRSTALSACARSVGSRARSWLQDTLKRKLVDFAWNRRFFYLPGACSPFSGEPG